MTLDELFIRDEKRAKKLYDTELLAKLLLINFEFSNQKYLGTTATDIYNNLHKIKYTSNDIEEIKTNAIMLLKIKYNIKVNDLEKLDFEKIN